MFQIKKLTINETNLHLKIDSTKVNDSIEISFRVRDNARWSLLERNQEIVLKKVKSSQGFELNVNMKDLINQFGTLSGKRNVIDVHVKHLSDYYKLSLSEGIVEYIRSNQQINLSMLLNLKYYVINNEILGIQLLAKNIKPALKEYNIEKDTVNFKVDTLLNNETSTLNGSRLIVLQRSILQTPQTYNAWETNIANETGSFFLHSNIFNKFILDEREVFDIFIEYTENNYSVQFPLNKGNTDINVKKWCTLNRVYNADIVKGKTGNLSIRFTKQKLHVDVEEIKEEQGILSLRMNNNFGDLNENLPILQIRSYLDGMYNKDTVIIYEQEISESLEKDMLLVSLNLNVIFADFTSSYNRKFKLFVEFGNNLYKITSLDTMKSPGDFKLKNKIARFDVKNYHYSIKLEKTTICCFFDDTLMLETSYINYNPIPIAVMGSCFSRSAFNSASYFNPDYKKHFQVSYSYFWPSVIGLVSEPLTCDKEMFSEISDQKLLEVEWEFLKNWDKSLKDSGAKYLLIDFFVDAMHGVLQLETDKYIARNLYTRKTKYYETTLIKMGLGIDCYHQEFFELWTKSFNKLIEKITKIIPEENIILNMAYLTDRYYDLNGEVKSFFDSKHITKAHLMHVNNTWKKMNNYFLSKLPNAKVIDMNRFQYIGYEDAPANLAPLGPHHFESGYYKSIITELTKVLGVRS